MIRTYDDANIRAIANAIRARSGTSRKYYPHEMAAAIESINSVPRIVTGSKACGLTQNGGTVTISGIDTNGLAAVYLAKMPKTGDMVTSSDPAIHTLFINVVGGKIGLSYHFRTQKSSTYYSYGVALNSALDADITVGDGSFTVSCSDFEDVVLSPSTAGGTDGWMYTAIYAG